MFIKFVLEQTLLRVLVQVYTDSCIFYLGMWRSASLRSLLFVLTWKRSENLLWCLFKFSDHPETTKGQWRRAAWQPLGSALGWAPAGRPAGSETPVWRSPASLLLLQLWNQTNQKLCPTSEQKCFYFHNITWPQYPISDPSKPPSAPWFDGSLSVIMLMLARKGRHSRAAAVILFYQRLSS